ncbi:hypothetical protein [Prescottella equi]|uniref:hypothetical protein n=1 Tax=Rhodococcus hoagii TaxID=43767 RepID=UPI00197E59B8|nr:hypothetical protein [Prescottella equi]
MRVAKGLRADLVALMLRASKGTVRLGGGSDLDEYEFPLITAREPVGELRHPVAGDHHIDGWQYRLYFGVPHEESDLLVFLLPGRKMSSKFDPTGWIETQRSHIDCAKQRMSVWVTNWYATSMRDT